MSDASDFSPTGTGTGIAIEAATGPGFHGLLLVSTPIGNLGDLSRRALDALRAADLVLCEDTRVTARLLAAHGLGVRTEPLHDHNEERRIPAVIERLRAGQAVVLVSDAGTPVVSDPGYRLVRAAIAEGLPVSALPGPNAAVTALVLSGLPPHPFLFLGFPPPKSAARRAGFSTLRAAEAAGLRATLVWYEAPHRVAAMLADVAETLGDRPAALARELTKRFEEVRRGSVRALLAGCEADPPRGEITVLVGPGAPEPPSADALDRRIAEILADHSPKDAATMVAMETGLPRKSIYGRILAMRQEENRDSEA